MNSNLEYDEVMIKCPICDNITEISIVIDGNITELVSNQKCPECGENLSKNYDFVDFELVDDEDGYDADYDDDPFIITID